MDWFKKSFSCNNDDRLERLVRRLIFYQDETTVPDALREAASFASTDDMGVRAMAEAIRRRCGNRPGIYNEF